MSMHVFRIDRVIGAALAVGLLALGLHANEGEEAATPAIDSTAIMQQVPSEALDSLYSGINADFQTVEPILRHSCYDCHSAETVFPWYHSLPLVKQFMDGHIEHGSRHLDMTKGFPFNDGKKNQVDLLKDMRDEIKDGDMPIFSYRLMHWGTLIKGKKQDSVFAWIDRTEAKLTAFGEEYPAFKAAQEQLKAKGKPRGDRDEDEDDD
jgi:hypothetical protein